MCECVEYVGVSVCVIVCVCVRVCVRERTKAGPENFVAICKNNIAIQFVSNMHALFGHNIKKSLGYGGTPIIGQPVIEASKSMIQ